MSQKLFEGIMTPLLSPLDEKERIIEKDLVRLVRVQLDRGINGFLAPSGTGEFFSLSDDERRRAVEIVAGEVRGRVPVVAMVGDCGAREVLKHIRAAREAGADAVMAPPVFFTVVDQAALKTFYKTIAAEGGMPLWLYQQPQETKLTLLPETVAELAELPNVVGIKVSCAGDLLNYHLILRAMRHKPEFRVLIGEDHNDLSAFVLGGHGAVAGLANVIPDEFLALWKAMRKGDLETARRAQSRIMDVQEALVFKTRCFQSALKVILHKRGIFSTTFNTNPLPPLTAEERKQTLALVKRLGL